VQPFVIYSYKIQAFNDEGSTISKPSFISINIPIQPCCRFTFRLFNIRSTQFDITWTIPERLNGLDVLYFINVYRKIDPFSSGLLDLIKENTSSVILEHNVLLKQSKSQTGESFTAEISNLVSYTQYYLEVRACNRDFNDKSVFYCLKGTAMEANTPVETLARFFTSQDKPDFQPPPNLITVSSSFVVISIPRPTRPNGIILLYEIWLKELINSNTTLSSSALYPNASNSSAAVGKQLACAIEDLYDPYDFNSTSAELTATGERKAKLKNCTILNLKPNALYSISATSSTIIGRSPSSRELEFTTLENMPTCVPRILLAGSFKSDNIYFSWQPTLQQSKVDPNWKSCIGGNLKNFSIYLLELNPVTNATEWDVILNGTQTTFNLTKVNKLYIFKNKYISNY
jgi:hypothetical protein